MASILDYLDWRGDLPFSAAPFNEIDGLILAEFGYIPLEGVVPGQFSIRQDLQGAWEKFDKTQVEEKMRIMSFEQDCSLFEKMAKSRRFSKTQLTGYVTRINTETQTQFSALTCLLEDGTTYISFRGTDGTIVGWKEDMNLSYMQETGSQSDARAYLNEHFRRHPRPIRVGGHSKGGNLAVYASAFCEHSIRGRIKEVQSYDGPGFREEIIETEEYGAVLGKVASFIPESSVVGMLLNNLADHTIVKSSASGIMQHLAYNWEVLGCHFVEADALSKSGTLLNKALTGFISQLNDEERRQLIESFFGVLEASDADTFREINKSKRTSYPAMLRAVRHLTPDQLRLFRNALISMAKSGKDAVLGENVNELTVDRPVELEVVTE